VRAARGERGAVTPLERPVTREVAELSEAVAAMAKSLEERAEYIRTFASHVSHEFKTPLTAIGGAVELVRTHEDMPLEQRRRFLDNVAADARRLDELVRRLLELARADVLRPAGDRADLGAVLAAVAESSGVELRLPVPDARVAIGAEALSSVVSSLVENARQHARGDVHVAIEARVDAGSRAVVRVVDDGPGVSAANAERIFDPFFTTARDAGGTGLGLTIVRSLLAAHGASIALVAAERGATLEISLPIA
jgi:signal transduction histidine kinase